MTIVTLSAVIVQEILSPLPLVIVLVFNVLLLSYCRMEERSTCTLLSVSSYVGHRLCFCLYVRKV